MLSTISDFVLIRFRFLSLITGVYGLDCTSCPPFDIDGKLSNSSGEPEDCDSDSSSLEPVAGRLFTTTGGAVAGL